MYKPGPRESLVTSARWQQGCRWEGLRLQRKAEKNKENKVSLYERLLMFVLTSHLCPGILYSSS